MTTFDEVRLDEDIERGATGGPEFNTTVIALTSGFEKRNINWSQTKASWDISYGIQSLTNLNDVITFFYARQGKARGFRFKDWADFTITGPQAIGTGTGAIYTFQIVKTYTSGGQTFTRNITKPVTGTLFVYVDGVLKTETSDYTVDYTTGRITFITAPANTKVVSVICEFDVPVRFDIDKLPINMELFNVGQISSINIVELKQ